jgi:hypothetical protein
LRVGDTAAADASLGANPPQGTDADQAFGGKVDCRGALHASGPGAMLRLTFTGLDPGRLYECIYLADRGGTPYSHWKEDAFVEIEGAETFRNESSLGTGYDGAGDAHCLLMKGYNTIKGDVVRLTGIRPGGYGAFSIRQTESNADGKEIYANTVILREYTR